MARTPRGSVPSYRLHKASGQAVCTVRTPEGGRRDVYLGEFGSPESREAYARLLAELKLPAAPSGPCPGLTVAELFVRFLDHAEVWYRRDDGTQTSEVGEFKRTIRTARQLYGSLPAAEFSPLRLQAVRQEMVRQDLSRGVINQRIGRLVRIFKWGVASELVPPAVYQALATVGGLPAGRTEARETEPVGAVSWELVQKTLPVLNPAVRGMVLLQWHSGARSQEVVSLRTCDIDRGGPVWLYRPGWHKTKRHGRKRVIAFGPKAQEVLAPFLREREPERVVFSPRDFPRGSWKKTRLPSERYTTLSYCDAVRKACERNGLPVWHPHQLRHAFATEVRKRHGLDAAQVLLGHARADVTEVYAHLDEHQIVRLAAEIG